MAEATRAQKRRRAKSRRSTIAYVGVDLSTTRDMTACVFALPSYDEAGTVVRVDVHPKFYFPSADVVRRERELKAPLRQWAMDGLLTLTDGDVVDYQWMRRDIVRAAEHLWIKQIGIDPYNASQFTQELQDDGFEVRMVRQGALTMGPLTKEVERLILEKRLRHPGHPILDWNINNCTLTRDANDNYWPAKTDAGRGLRGPGGRVRYQIDGAIAMIEAVGMALTDEDKPRRSVYARRGVRRLG